MRYYERASLGPAIMEARGRRACQRGRVDGEDLMRAFTVQTMWVEVPVKRASFTILLELDLATNAYLYPCMFAFAAGFGRSASLKPSWRCSRTRRVAPF